MDLPDKSAQDKPKVQQVVSGAKQVSRPATRRFKDYVFAESPRALGAKVASDVIVPRLKAGIEEALNSFLSGMLWGDSAVRPMAGVGRTVLRGGGVAYNAVSSQQGSLLAARQATQQRSTGNYEDLIVPTQQQAEILLANLYELLNQYRVVAVGDLNDLAGISSQISDNGYGWTNLEGARISKVRDGYLLGLPRPTLI